MGQENSLSTVWGIRGWDNAFLGETRAGNISE